MVVLLKGKKMKILLTVLVVMFVSIVTMCCTKSIKPFDDDRYWIHNWTEYSFVNHIIQSRNINNRLYTISPHYIRIYDDITKSWNDSEMIPTNSGAIGFNSRPVMSDDFAVFADSENNQRLFIRLLAGTNTHTYNSTYANTSIFDDPFEDYVFMTSINPKKGFGVFNGNRFVTAISKQSTGGDVRMVYFDLGYNDHGRLRVVDSGMWDIPILSLGSAWIYDIECYNDQFYVSYNRDHAPQPSRGYLILSNDGAHDIWHPQFNGRNEIITKFFHFEGSLFAHFGNGDIWHTKDGVNWTSFAYIFASIHDITQLDDYMFFALNSSIGFYADVLGEPYLNIVPISNLAGATITGLHKIDDYFVITTTNGIYYKNFNRVIKDARNNKNTKNNRGEDEELFNSNDFYYSIF